MTKVPTALPDTNQNFWQLASIQVMTYGVQGILLGSYVAKDFGIGSACISILIGNLVLWAIGRSMIAMSSEGRNNAIQNVGNYFGIGGAVIANLVLSTVFLIWYPINLGCFVSSLDSIIPNHFPMFNYLGIVLGFLTAFLAAGGIVLIKKICVTAFFILLGLFFVSFFLFESNFVFGAFEFSLMGTVALVLSSLSGMINLPTFFRHSRSRADSVVGLSMTTIVISIFQFLGILSGFFSKFNGLNNSLTCSTGCILFAIIFIVIGSVCVNLGNIYFSSAVIEFFFPKARKSIGYVLIGLCGSIFYALFGLSKSFVFTEYVVEGFIVNLSAILLMAFICKIAMHHRTRLVEKLGNNICWFLGCIVSFYVAAHSISGYSASIFAGMVTVILSFITFLLIEKTVESIRCL